MHHMIMPPRRSCFCHKLAAKNNLDLREWLFYPGMLFGSTDKWWGDRNARNTPHEGIDLCFYRSSSGSVLVLEPCTLIPILYDGEIIRIVDDFLGRTVFVRHPGHEENNRELYSIYGHVTPMRDLFPGTQLQAGDIIGSLTAPRQRTSVPPPHLHLSAALISKTFPPARLDWHRADSEKNILFIDPLPLIDCAYAFLQTPQD